MTTTLNQIRSHNPCQKGWAKLLKHLGKTTADDEPLSLLTVLESNGLVDSIWCLRTEATPERIQSFTLAVARRVEHLSKEAKDCNDVTERYLAGLATKEELDTATHAVHAAAHAIAYAAGSAAAYAAHAAHAAAHAAVYAIAYAAGHAIAYATYAADTATYADDAAANAAEHQAQEQLFREIFA